VLRRRPADAIKDTGRAIAEARRKRGWTQEGFAKRLGISTSYLRQIEQGTRIISLWRFYEIAFDLDVTGAKLTSPDAKAQPAGRPPKDGPDRYYKPSKYTGVYWRNGAYHGFVEHDGARHTVKKGLDEEKVARARDKLAKRLHGPRAKLNFS
jgi:transcriptional regulator with XRE-family HTH domain